MLDYVFGGLNVMTAGMLWFGLRDTLRRRQQNRRQLEQIQNCKHYSLSKHDTIDITSIKDGKSAQMVYIEVANKQVRNFTDKTFTRQYNTVKSDEYRSYLDDGFMTNGCGGSFTINRQNGDIIVDIRDCNIYGQMLKKQSHPIIMKNKDKTQEATITKYENIVYRTVPNMNLAIIGTLGYNTNTNQLLLLPNFMLPQMKAGAVLEEVKTYLNTQNSHYLLGSIFFSASLIFLLFCNWKRLKHIWKNAVNKIQSIFRKQFHKAVEQFSVVQTKGSQRLRCQCKKNPINIIYQCGHLNKCQVCHKADQIKKCTICEKLSHDFMKVFI